MSTNSGASSTCVYCRAPIRWEDTEFTKRWVHLASDIPLCRPTVATPVASHPSCFCGSPDDRERVHRAHECVAWVTRPTSASAEYGSPPRGAI